MGEYGVFVLDTGLHDDIHAGSLLQTAPCRLHAAFDDLLDLAISGDRTLIHRSGAKPGTRLFVYAQNAEVNVRDVRIAALVEPHP